MLLLCRAQGLTLLEQALKVETDVPMPEITELTEHGAVRGGRSRNLPHQPAQLQGNGVGAGPPSGPVGGSGGKRGAAAVALGVVEMRSGGSYLVPPRPASRDDPVLSDREVSIKGGHEFGAGLARQKP